MKTDLKKWVLILRYLTGNILPEERREMELWLDQDPENRKTIEDIEEIFKVTPDEEFEANAEHSWELFHQKLTEDKDHKKTVSLAYRKAIGIQKYAYQIAAIILVSLFTGILVQHYMAKSYDAVQRAEPLVMQDLITQQGEKAQVTFSDGTEVTLNSASSLQFPEEFHDSTREVHLEGEAYFKVKHDPERPFIVHNQDVEVKVLGTEFNVSGWSADPSVDITVREGKVSVSSTDPQIEDHSEEILTEGFFTSVRTGNKPDPAQKIDVRNNVLWLSGGMHFDNVPFDQVMKKIERRFNVKITNKTKQLDASYTGTFHYADIDEILSVIAASLKIEYRRKGSEIEFN